MSTTDTSSTDTAARPDPPEDRDADRRAQLDAARADFTVKDAALWDEYNRGCSELYAQTLAAAAELTDDYDARAAEIRTRFDQ